MKTNLFSLTLIALFSSSVMPNSGISIKDIQTVEDVQDIRNKIIFRMTEVLNTEITYRGFTPSLFFKVDLY